MPDIIFIDDDTDFLAAQVQSLTLADLSVKPFSNGADALKQITSSFAGIVLTDVRMAGMDGFAVFRRVQAIDPEIPVILLTGHGDIQMAVQAMKEGAYDFVTKPFSGAELIISVRRAIQKRQLTLENNELRLLQARNSRIDSEPLGASAVMTNLRSALAKVAEADVDVLITGDTGVGKETAARVLHQISRRRSKSFIQINCASLQESNFQVELLGSEVEGSIAHAGANRRLVGRIDRAHRGTLMLDDVGKLSPAQQALILTILEHREIWPVGAAEPRAVDIRVVSTAHCDLETDVKKGLFRADLFYQLSGVSVRVPPLAERKEDIKLLFQHFLVTACARLKQPIPQLSLPVHAYLQTYNWPGNVRELQQFAERFALGLEDKHLMDADADSDSLASRVAQFEADLLRETLRFCGGDAQRAIALLKIPRKTFYDKLNRHGIRASEFRQDVQNA
jgi:two-component system C4-dicarboxylate transport response regulator DctD